jgi:hypothetical protein
MTEVDRIKEEIISIVKDTDDEEFLLSVIKVINNYIDKENLFTPAQQEFLRKNQSKKVKKDSISGSDLEILDESG